MEFAGMTTTGFGKREAEIMSVLDDAASLQAGDR